MVYIRHSCVRAAVLLSLAVQVALAACGDGDQRALDDLGPSDVADAEVTASDVVDADDAADDISTTVPPDDPDYWVQTAGPPGGAIFTLEVDLMQPETVYAGGQGGRLFVSTDAGASWTQGALFYEQNRDLVELIVDPSDADTLYALPAYDTLFKSTDAGLTWSAFEQFSGLFAVAMSPADAGTLIVGGGGLVAVTTDGGASWTDVSAAFPPDVPIRDVAAGGSSEYWAATDAQGEGGAGELLHSTNGGAEWDVIDLGAQMPAQAAVAAIFVDPADTRRVFVGLFFPSNLGGAEGDVSMLRTMDGGQSWTGVTLPGPPVGGQIVGRDPSGDAIYATNMMDLLVTTDLGDTWTSLGFPPGISVVDPVDLAVDPTDGSVLYLPTRAEGVAKSTDGGQTWRAVNQGIRANSVSLIAVASQAEPGTIYTSGAPGLYRTDDWGQSWRRVDRPDIYHPFVDEIVVSPHDDDSVWVVTDAAHVFVSDDRGESFELEVDTRSGGRGFRFGSVYALAAAPSDPDTIYAVKNGFGIFRTTDGGSRWNFLRDSEVDYSYSLAVHPTDPQVVFSGYNPKPFQDFAMVRRTVDGGETWTTALELDGATAVTSVAIDPQAPQTVYAASTGEAGGRLWVSLDGGDQWDRLGAIDFTNIHTMTTVPSDPAGAIAAVWGGGTFVTVESGDEWLALADAPTQSASAVMVDGGDPPALYLADRTAPRIYRAAPGHGPQRDWDVVFDAGDAYYRVLTAALAPSDESVLYAAVFGRGTDPTQGSVFRIDNGVGTDITGDLPGLPVAFAIDPSDADVVFVALHGAGSGVYRTDDGGDSWSLISGAASGLPQTPAVGFNGLTLVPGDPPTLYLFGGSDAYFDSGGIAHTGAAAADLNTVYVSHDAGDRWSRVDDGTLGASSGGIKALAVHPENPDVLFAGALNGVFRSVDGGATWTDVTSGLDVAHTAGVALSSDGVTLYAPTLGGGMFVGQVAASTFDVTWRPESTLGCPIYHAQVAVHPSDSSTLYASAYPGGVFKSTDGGATFAEQNFGLPSFHIDDPLRQGYYALAIAPSSPEVLYLGIYGVGVYRSTDGAATWLRANGSDRSLDDAAITSLVVDPDEADRVFVGTEDGVYRTEDGGADWSRFDDGLDARDVRSLALTAHGRLLAGTRGYELHLSTTSTPDWAQMTAFDNWGAVWPIWDNRPLYQYTALLFHPNDPTVLYLGTFPAGIFRSDDGGQSWRERTVGWTNDGVFSLVTHPDDPEIIYAGTYNGLNRTLDGAGHWEMWDTGWPPEQWVFSVAFDPRDADVMYACSKNGENEGRGSEELGGTVMKTTDGGETWFSITDGLDVHQELYGIVVDPNRPDTVYLGSQRDGVYVSRNGGGAWTAFNEGLDNPYAGTNGNNVTHCLELSPDGRYLYFGTAGSGLYRRRIAP